MNSWINLHALWKIVAIGLLAGAGLPALFAVGLRALAPRGAAGNATGNATGNANAPGSGAGTGKAGSGEAAVAELPPDTLGKVIAGVCFLAVVGAMVWGVYSIVHGS